MLDVMLHPGIRAKDPETVLLFDTSVGSLNMGDTIIKQYCDRALAELLAQKNVVRVPTHALPDKEQLAEVSRAGTKIVCGTNLITPHYEAFSNWKMPYNLSAYRDIVTLGVGWGYYCETTSSVSKFVYRTILSGNMLHSVRDSYTEQKFREMGITNVVNTGCPALWGLTEQHCEGIPAGKARRVITALTDYARDEQADRKLLEILNENYEKVYVWLQGADDLAYLKSLAAPQTVEIISRDLEAYTEVLSLGDIDYVGTRLHAGIHAMNLGVRSIILAVDNRAAEMGRDFNLPVIRRDTLEDTLKDKICAHWKTQVRLPVGAIEAWKKQF